MLRRHRGRRRRIRLMSGCAPPRQQVLRQALLRHLSAVDQRRASSTHINEVERTDLSHAVCGRTVAVHACADACAWRCSETNGRLPARRQGDHEGAGQGQQDFRPRVTWRTTVLWRCDNRLCSVCGGCTSSRTNAWFAVCPEDSRHPVRPRLCASGGLFWDPMWGFCYISGDPICGS